jgi:hypothetical protein
LSEQPDGQDDDSTPDAFDRRVNALLAAEEQLLADQAELLLTTGSIFIERPRGTVRVLLRRPALRRKGQVRLDATATDGSTRGAHAHGPTAANYRDRSALVEEMVLLLAVHLAWLQEDE